MLYNLARKQRQISKQKINNQQYVTYIHTISKKIHNKGNDVLICFQKQIQSGLLGNNK